MFIKDMVSSKANIKDFALITHAVPSRRLKRILPFSEGLEVFRDKETSEEMAFISVACFKNEDFRPTALGAPRVDFNQITYRTYFNIEGKPTVFFLGVDVGTWPAFGFQKLNSPNVKKGDIEIMTNIDEVEGGYDIYDAKSESENGHLEFSATAKQKPYGKDPFLKGEEKSLFLTHRLHSLLRTPAGFLGDQAVDHKVMDPWEGELRRFKSDFWTKKGLLKADETQERLYSVLINRSVEFKFYPPIPAKLLLRSAPLA